MIEIVNGYACASCAEAADAIRGKNPHAKPDEPPQSLDKKDKISAFAGQPAVVFDGALKALLSANPVTPVSASGASQQTGANLAQRGVDRLA